MRSFMPTHVVSIRSTTRIPLPLLSFIHPPSTFKNPSSSKTLTKMSSSSSPSHWTCKKCTFINPQSKITSPSCQICLSPSSPPQPPPSSFSSSSSQQWACKTCTFLNPYTITSCEMCGARASSLALSVVIEDDELDNSSVGSVFLPLRACSNTSKRKGRRGPIEIVDEDDGGGFRGIKAANKAVASSDKDIPKAEERVLKVLSYNVWFREDLELHQRMKTLGDLIQLHSPDLICLQEVTPNIYDIFQQSSWWSGYYCSVTSDMALTKGYFCMQLSKHQVKSFSCKPFSNSIMGRELCVAELEVEKGLPLVVATSHLESPCPGPPTWDQMFSKERVQQANKALDSLNQYRNVIFCGDMNWCDKLDGKFPLLDGWDDAWEKLRPGENGWTYDTKTNLMLSGNRALQKRLDRFVCKLSNFRVSNIEMIGMEAIPGLSYVKEKKVKKELKHLELPVLPSDHYGLLLTFNPM